MKVNDARSLLQSKSIDMSDLKEICDELEQSYTNAARLLAGWKEADEVMSHALSEATRGNETFKRFWCLVRRETCSPTVLIDMLKRFEDKSKHAALIQILHALLGARLGVASLKRPATDEFFVLTSRDKKVGGLSPKGRFKKWPLYKGFTFVTDLYLDDEEGQSALFEFSDQDGNGMFVEIEGSSLYVRTHDFKTTKAVHLPIRKWCRIAVLGKVSTRLNISMSDQLFILLDNKLALREKFAFPRKMPQEGNFCVSLLKGTKGFARYVGLFTVPLEPNDLRRAQSVLSRDPYELDTSSGGIRGSKQSMWRRMLFCYHPRATTRRGTDDLVCLDLYGNVDVEVSDTNVQIWSTQTAKQSLQSLGGVQALFPIFAQLRPEETSISLSVGMLLVCIVDVLTGFLDHNFIGQKTFQEGQGTSLLKYYLTHVPLAQLDSKVHSLSSTFAHSFRSLVECTENQNSELHKELLRLFFDHTNVWSVQRRRKSLSSPKVKPSLVSSSSSSSSSSFSSSSSPSSEQQEVQSSKRFWRLHPYQESILAIQAAWIHEKPFLLQTKMIDTSSFVDALVIYARQVDERDHQSGTNRQDNRTTTEKTSNMFAQERCAGKWIHHIVDITRNAVMTSEDVKDALQNLISVIVELSETKCKSAGFKATCMAHAICAELLLLMLWFVQLPNKKSFDVWSHLSELWKREGLIPSMIAVLYSECEEVRALAIHVIGAVLFYRPEKFGHASMSTMTKKKRSATLSFVMGAARRIRSLTSIDPLQNKIKEMEDRGLFACISSALRAAGRDSCGVETYSALLSIALASPLDRVRESSFQTFRSLVSDEKKSFLRPVVDDSKSLTVAPALQIVLDLLVPISRVERVGYTWRMPFETQQVALMELQLILRQEIGNRTCETLLEMRETIPALLSVASAFWSIESKDNDEARTSFDMTIKLLLSILSSDLASMEKKSKRGHIWEALRQLCCAATMVANGIAVVRHIISLFVHTERKPGGMWHILDSSCLGGYKLWAAVELVSFVELEMPSLWSVTSLEPKDEKENISTLTLIPVPRCASSVLSCRSLALQMLSLFEGLSNLEAFSKIGMIGSRSVCDTRESTCCNLRFLLIRLALRLLPMSCYREGAHLSGLSFFTVYKMLKPVMQNEVRSPRKMNPKRLTSDDQSTLECLLTVAFSHNLLVHVSSRVSEVYKVLASDDSDNVVVHEKRIATLLTAASSVARILQRVASSNALVSHTSKSKQQELEEMLSQWKTAPTDPSWLSAGRAGWLASQPLLPGLWRDVSESLVGRSFRRDATDQWQNWCKNLVDRRKRTHKRHEESASGWENARETLILRWTCRRQAITKRSNALRNLNRIAWSSIQEGERIWTLSFAVDEDDSKSHEQHWKLSEHQDYWGRRILMEPNEFFDLHLNASRRNSTEEEKSKDDDASDSRGGGKNLPWKLTRHSSAKFLDVDGSDDEGKIEDENDEHDEEKIQEDSRSKAESAENKEQEGKDNEEDEKKEEEDDVVEKDVKDENDGEWTNITQKHQSRLAPSLEKGENIMFETTAEIISPLRACPGRLIVTSLAIHFLYDDEPDNIASLEESNKEMSSNTRGITRWNLDDVKDIQPRRYLLSPSSLEFFFITGNSVFLNIPYPKPPGGRMRLMKVLLTCEIPRLRAFESMDPIRRIKKSGLTERWRRREITNLEYLLQLNNMAGRTYQDLTQYPVMPWILADYKSHVLDLNSPSSFRDLSLPIGALNPDRLKQFLVRRNQFHLDSEKKQHRFIYGSHYSTVGTALYYLVRMEPFSSLHIEFQDGHFDVADRLFCSVKEAWENSLNSMSDVKELIPAFFSCPQMFQNQNHFELGKRDNGSMVGDVELPPWADNSAEKFVRMHRHALESEYVSERLHLWIDLIFGFKQQGEYAEKANNVFHELTYEGAVDISSITDEIEREATIAQIQYFGQTPSQLFKHEHPQRYSKSLVGLELLLEPRLKRKFTMRPMLKLCSDSDGCKASKIQVCRDSRHAIGITVKDKTCVISQANAHAKSQGLYVGYKVTHVNDVAIQNSSDFQKQLKGLDKFSLTIMHSPESSSSSSKMQNAFGVVSCQATISKNLGRVLIVVRDNMSVAVIPAPNKLDFFVWKSSFHSSTMRDPEWKNMPFASAHVLGSTRATEWRRKQKLSVKFCPSRCFPRQIAIPNRGRLNAELFFSCGYWNGGFMCHDVDTKASADMSTYMRERHGNVVTCCALTADAATLLTGGVDFRCCVWTVKGGGASTTLDDYLDIFDPSVVVSSSSTSLSFEYAVSGHSAPLTAITVSSVLGIFATVSLDGSALLYLLGKGKRVRRWKHPDGLTFDEVKLTDDGNIILHSHEDKSIFVYSINGPLIAKSQVESPIRCMEVFFAPEGIIIVYGDEDGRIVIMRANDLKALDVLDAREFGGISCLSFEGSGVGEHGGGVMFAGCPNGQLLALFSETNQTTKSNELDTSAKIKRSISSDYELV